MHHCEHQKGNNCFTDNFVCIFVCMFVCFVFLLLVGYLLESSFLEKSKLPLDILGVAITGGKQVSTGCTSQIRSMPTSIKLLCWRGDRPYLLQYKTLKKRSSLMLCTVSRVTLYGGGGIWSGWGWGGMGGTTV